MTLSVRDIRFWALIALALVCFYLSSCGMLPANAEVDPEFRIIYSGFEADAAKYGREIDQGNLVIRMGAESEFDANEAGNCAPGKVVSVNPTIWKTLTRYGKELLIYHELGHCLLGLTHDSESIIMQPSMSQQQYAFRRQDAIEELFKTSGGSVTPAAYSDRINTLR
jgi:hypothetical protein